VQDQLNFGFIAFHALLSAAQETIIQNLQYFDHLAEPMAELLSTILSDSDDDVILDNLLR
jgi:condensin complex subunit 1